MMFGTYPNTLGTHDEPNSPDYNSHAYLWGSGRVLSGFNAIVQKHRQRRLPHHLREPAQAHPARILQHHERAHVLRLLRQRPRRAALRRCHLGRHRPHRPLTPRPKTTGTSTMPRACGTLCSPAKDDALGGGIYWKESPRDSKNTCSNAPAVVLALKLYQVTNDPSYLETGKEVYKWVKSKLQDPADYLYWDCIKIDGTVGDQQVLLQLGADAPGRRTALQRHRRRPIPHRCQTAGRGLLQLLLREFSYPTTRANSSASSRMASAGSTPSWCADSSN